VHPFVEGDAALFIANGVTTVRNLSGRPQTTALAQRIAAGEIPGPTIYSSSPIVDGPTRERSNPRAVRDAAEMRARVADLANAPENYIGVKLYENLSREAFAAGVAAAHEHGLQAYGHVPFSASVDDVLAMQIDSIEHLIGFERTLAPDFHGAWDEEQWTQADMSLAPDLARRVANSGVWVVPTLVTFVDAARGFADVSAARSAREYRYATPHQRERWQSIYETVADPQAAWLTTQRAHQMRLAVVRALHDAGARLLTGTDAPQPFVYAGFSLHREFEFYREAGLEPGEILRAASAEAARFLGRETEFGVIAPGARADLLLLDGDPEEDLALLRTPAGVMAAGRWYDRAALRHLLDVTADRIAANLAPSRE
jgi:imidazolonepropionase-like amidohydrolase